MPKIWQVSKIANRYGTRVSESSFSNLVKTTSHRALSDSKFRHQNNYRRTIYTHFEEETIVLFYLHQQAKIRGCDTCSNRILQQHWSIQRTPNSVNSENQETVWFTLYADPDLRKPQLKVSDQVRLSMTRMRFRKSYLSGWTDEFFQVAQVFRDNPPYYKIKDLPGELLEGTFYQEELQKIYKKNDVFWIERIFQQAGCYIFNKLVWISLFFLFLGARKRYGMSPLRTFDIVLFDAQVLVIHIYAIYHKKRQQKTLD